MDELEKEELEIRFIPIVCSTPLIYAQSHGFFEKNGLKVNLKRVSGWSGIKGLLTREKIDAAHMLTPMPFASTLGIDGYQKNLKLLMIQNTNGQALTISLKHKDIKSIKEMKGFTFGVPYKFSMHYYLLCYFLAYHGVNPLEDVTIVEVSPSIMPYYLRKGWVDGIFAPEPYNQISVHQGVGFIHTLSRNIWLGHPCCSFATTANFPLEYPNTYRAMLNSILASQWALHTSSYKEKKLIAKEISSKEFLNVPEFWKPVMEVLTGNYPDGLGNQFDVPDRIGFIPFPRKDFGVWILSQMQRWNQLQSVVDYQDIIEDVVESRTFDIAKKLGFNDDSPPLLSNHLMGESFEVESAFEFMKKQPFSSYQEKKDEVMIYDDVKQMEKRISEITDNLSDVAGGNLEKEIKITSNGEIGLLERVLNDSIRNLKFSQQALEERKEHLEKEVLQYIEDLEQSNDELAQFAYIASHDLQEPLRMVTSFLQLLKRNYSNELDVRGVEFIDYAVDGALRMNQLIEGLLIYSRIGSTPQPFKPVKMDKILLEALDNLQIAIDENEAKITSDSLPEITADASQMLQLFQNIIGNAIKFRSKETPHIHVGVQKLKTKWKFSAKDNGIGIDSRFHEKIFGIFQRLHVRDEIPGTGVGLAICKKIVEQHKGRIWLKSKLGKGSTFYFTIPRKRHM